MKYLLTGGGTGGHVYPALAIADEIRRHEKEAEFLYVGVRGRLEESIVPGRGYPIRYVRARPLPRAMAPWALARFVLALAWGILQASVLLLRWRPAVIVGTGGFASAPVLFAHSLLRRIGLSRAKSFIYEPNAFPGRLNKAVGRYANADRIGLAFEEAGRWFDMKRVAIVGCPVRRAFFETRRDEARRVLGIDDSRLVLLAFGGSGGSRVINEAVVDALPHLRQRDDLLVLHITGRQNGPEYRAVAETEAHLQRLGIEGDTAGWYRRFDYMEDIHQAYAAADMAICRGGASTLTEVCLCGLPALVVPLPTAAEDHQAINARELERLGAARVVYQEARWRDGRVDSHVDGGRLARIVLGLAEDPERRNRMGEAARSVPRRDSLALICNEIKGMVEGRRRVPLNLEFPDRPPAVPRDPNALLRYVRGRLEESGGIGHVEEREIDYWRYQADRLLCSEAWYEVPLGRRNVGIKLVGYLQYRRHLPLLLEVLADRRPVGWLQRLAGGDFRHAGILRRNAVEYGVRHLAVADAPVRQALLEALQNDPYFEVRAVAAQVLGELFEGDAGIEEALVRALDDRVAPVVVQAARALGNVGATPGIVEHLRRFYLHGDWKLRHEIVGCLTALLRRGVVRPEEIAGDLERILAASPYFRPTFPLQDSLRELAELTDGTGQSSLRRSR